MAISVRCGCKAAFEVPPSFAGKSAMCPGCGTFHDIPEDGRSVDVIAERQAERRAAADDLLSPRELKGLIRDGFDGTIRPVRRTAGYRFAVILVAAAMLVLPALYVGLIALVAVALVWHVTTNYTLFREVRIHVALLMYVLPVLVGVPLIGFLLKPLLARPSRARRGRPINLDKEPVLATFVDEIAAAVHAPKPRRIEVNCEVNASAGFGRGLFAMFGRNLTLTIGLPLVAGLSARQLAGVLAHEFGHFSQGAGMRVSYVVRSINAWFARVVFERDAWDEWLDEWKQESGLGGLVATTVHICVLGTRAVLWVFMVAGHGVSCFLLRRMEFDADRSEARLVGTRTFEKTFRRLATLGAAAEEAGDILHRCYEKERYPDDLPALVVGLASSMSTRERERVLDELVDARTGLFDTHPSFSDRLASVEDEDPPGVFDTDLPAAALFRQLPKLTESASVDHYRGLFGGGIQTTLRPVADFLKGRARQAARGTGWPEVQVRPGRRGGAPRGPRRPLPDPAGRRVSRSSAGARRPAGPGRPGWPARRSGRPGRTARPRASRRPACRGGR